MTDYPYYVEIEYPFYPTKNKHQKAIMIKANTLRPAPTNGFYAGDELAKIRSEMVIEALDTINEVLAKLDPKGLADKARMGTEESIPLSHGTPNQGQNSPTSEVKKTPEEVIHEHALESQARMENEPSEKQWNYLSFLTKNRTLAYARDTFYEKKGWNQGTFTPNKTQMKEILDFLTTEKNKIAG